MAEVLGRRLARTVTFDELGFGFADNRIGTRYPATPVEAVATATALWRLLVRRKDHLDGVPFVPGAAVEAGFAWRFDSADTDVSRPGSHRVVSADVAALKVCAADDHQYGAHVLANLATQAVYLGQSRAAVRLSKAAVDGAGRGPAWIMARLHTTEATAHAIAGDRHACTAALRRANVALERGHSGDVPPWAGYFSHFAGTALRCFRDLRMFRTALRHAPAALALAADKHRTRALHTALLATTHAASGQLDAACEVGSEALALSSAVQSARVRERLVELAGRLRPHHGDRNVAELLGSIAAHQ
jgi:hypothetical protein